MIWRAMAISWSRSLASSGGGGFGGSRCAVGFHANSASSFDGVNLGGGRRTGRLADISPRVYEGKTRAGQAPGPKPGGNNAPSLDSLHSLPQTMSDGSDVPEDAYDSDEAYDSDDAAFMDDVSHTTLASPSYSRAHRTRTSAQALRRARTGNQTILSTTRASLQIVCKRSLTMTYAM